MTQCRHVGEAGVEADKRQSSRLEDGRFTAASAGWLKDWTWQKQCRVDLGARDDRSCG